MKPSKKKTDVRQAAGLLILAVLVWLLAPPECSLIAPDDYKEPVKPPTYCIAASSRAITLAPGESETVLIGDTGGCEGKVAEALPWVCSTNVAGMQLSAGTWITASVANPNAASTSVTMTAVTGASVTRAGQCPELATPAYVNLSLANPKKGKDIDNQPTTDIRGGSIYVRIEHAHVDRPDVKYTKAQIKASPGQWNFGSVTVNGVANRTVVVQNPSSTESLLVTAINANTWDFQIAPCRGMCNILIPPSGNSTVQVTFKPPKAGSFTDTLTITGENAKTGEAVNAGVVSLTGTGVAPPPAVVSVP
ncbi:MAG: hypothetical protein EHM61_24280 [Acidobacteria bacterium]|nr:MAG: hypothetical protein EHM61_24280 [Acidobacteriota bacterium]